jgi:2-polyprenyl-3-methyl-5-hydroxy-6-metoxy-1,4-benzoquinol methylase
VTSVAVLHHLPDQVSALRDWAALLSPGGVLLVQDILARPGVRGVPANVLALLAAAPARVLAYLSPHRRALRAAYAEHGAGEHYLTLSDARALARDSGLAGAQVREHLSWRFSLVWKKPSAS